MLAGQDYFTSFEHAKLARDDNGVLLVTFHTAGDTLMWGPGPHDEFGHLFRAIAGDPLNRIVVLTGAGDEFCVRRDPDAPRNPLTAERWDHVLHHGINLIEDLLSINVPVIGAVNGPATWHAELLLLSDIVVAADHATLGDAPHFPLGVVPGDGIFVMWNMLLGPNRARSMLLLEEELTPLQAKDLGVVHSVVPRDQLMQTALAMAAKLSAKPSLGLRYTRSVFVDDMKRRMRDGLRMGLALEGLAMMQSGGSASRPTEDR